MLTNRSKAGIVIAFAGVAIVGSGIYSATETSYSSDVATPSSATSAATPSPTTSGTAPEPSYDLDSDDITERHKARLQMYEEQRKEREQAEARGVPTWIEGSTPEVLTRARNGEFSTYNSGQLLDSRSFGRTTPGQTLYVNGRECTLGALAYQGSTPVYLTAGHCGGGIVGSAFAEQTPNGRETLGTSTHVTERSSGLTTTPDIAIIPAAGYNSSSAPRIGGEYTVTGVATAEDITGDTEVCKYGMKTGETCGTVMAMENDYIRVGNYSVGGDSGSPAYIKTGGGNALLVGFLSGSPRQDEQANDYVNDYTLAYTTFEELGLSLRAGGGVER